MINFSLLTNLLNNDVFVLIFSTNASCGPFITFSFIGLSIFRCLNPFTSILKATSIVSINNTQFPDFILSHSLLNSVSSITLFCGIKAL